MAEVVQLKAEARADNGRGASRALRRQGMVPAVIYGGSKANEYVFVDERFVRKQYERGGFSNRIVELETGSTKVRVLPRDVQLHPVSDKPLHVDFQRLIPGQKIRIAVPVAFIGEAEAPGLKRGGIVNVARREIDVLAEADAIPDRIVVNLAGLDINESVHISEIELPKGVSPALKRDFTIASITAPTAVREEALEAAARAAAAAATPEATAEGATPAEGAGAAPAADAKAAAGAKEGGDAKAKK